MGTRDKYAIFFIASTPKIKVVSGCNTILNGTKLWNSNKGIYSRMDKVTWPQYIWTLSACVVKIHIMLEDTRIDKI